MFSMLNDVDIAAVKPPPSSGSQPSSRRPNRDSTNTRLGSAGGRRTLRLLPRTLPVGPGESESEPEGDEIRESEEVAMSREAAEKKVKEDVKELFAVRDLDEAEEYFKALPSVHHPHLIDQILMQVLDKKEADAKFVAGFFEQAAEKQLCTQSNFEEGFKGAMAPLDDLAIDVPAVFKLMAIAVQGAQLPMDAVERLSEKIMFEGDPLVSPRKKFLNEYEKLL
jgi:translation initiation factor 4G